ncbi:MAG: relaxase/mobilization nuclease domain-containing protein, partial [Burkholderiaceae bacterium]
MIAKKVPNPKKSASKSERVGGLTDYITAPEHKNGLEKCIHFAAVNFLTDTLAAQKLEMIALSQEGVKSKDPIDHWVLSWRHDEHPTPEQARIAVAMFIEHCGLSGHQYLWGLHDDTQNRHVHIAVNRVHPDTLRVTKINQGFDREASQQAIALIEHA